MKIKSLEIKGFRSLKDVTWEPGDLNVVIGPNGSGKSNLLQFLEMVSASAKGKLGDWVQDAGGITQLVWDGSAERIFIKVKLSQKGNGKIPEYSMMVEKTAKGTFCIETEIMMESDKRNVFNRLKDSGIYFDSKEKGYGLDKEINLSESVLSTLLNVTDYRKEWNNLFSDSLRWAIFHEFSTVKDGKVRRPFAPRYETHVQSDGQNLVSVLHTLYENQQFKEYIDNAMWAVYGDEYKELFFGIAADGLNHMKIRWKSLKTAQSTFNLSDGTLRFLYLITILAMPDPPPLIAIDEPETGLHPSMLPIIAEYAADAADRTQVIFTTHSPEFLDALSELNPTVTVTNCKDGETSLTVLDGERLKHWLKNYQLGTLFSSGELTNFAEDENQEK